MASNSILLALCFSSIIFLSPSPSMATMSTSAKLVKDLCGRTRNYRLCAAAMESDPKTASATKTVTIAQIAIKRGIANAKRTKSFILDLQERGEIKPDMKLKKTIEVCASQYDVVIGSMRSALGELEEDAMTANYDAMVIGDSLSLCEKTMEANGVRIESILSKNNVARQYAEIAIAATELVGG